MTSDSLNENLLKLASMSEKTFAMVEGLYENIIPEMQERMGRHSLDAKNDIRDMRSDLKDVSKTLIDNIQVEKQKIENVDRRVYKLETERGIAVKVATGVTPLVSALVSAVTAYFVGHKP